MSFKHAVTFVTGLLAAFMMSAQSRFTISGYITDADSGEPIIGAAVIDKDSMLGVISGNTGFYSLSLPAGERTVIFSYLGFDDRTEVIDLKSNITLNIGLNASNTQLETAVVTAQRKVTGANSTQMSAIEVPISQIKAIPAIGGEVDVIKALQLLPGVQSGSEGQAGLYVRGGGADENLLLMDGVPLYNVNHLFGFFSVFNADAVKNVTLYKGSFPARFGGHLSSVVDVRLNDGDEKEYHGNVSIGLISSKINVEGPIVKGKTTFNISARRTYLDLLAKPAIWYANRQAYEGKEDYEKYGGGYDFYDLNAKITHKFKGGDRLSLSFYSGDDKASINTEDVYAYNEMEWDSNTHETVPTGEKVNTQDNYKFGWRWGNMVTSLRYDHIVTPKLYMSANASYTQYRSYLDLEMSEYYSRTFNQQKDKTWSEATAGMSYNTMINDWAATADFDWRPAPQHDVKFGGNYTFHTFKPGIISTLVKEEASDTKAQTDKQNYGNTPIRSNEAALYAEDNWAITPWLKANLGLRTSLYNVGGKTYFSAEPRLSARALISDEFSFKASYSEMSQYIHLLCNSNLSLPSDLWVPVTENIKPMRSRQTAAGFFYDRGRFEYSIEGYYKTMDNVLEYKDGASYFSTGTGWEEKVSMGKGWSYGVEFLVQKKTGRLGGWIGYTLAKSMRKFDKPGMEINDGVPFPAKYDRRHDLSAVATYTFNKKWDISGTFVYASGNCGSLAYDYFNAEEVYGTGSDAGLHNGYWYNQSTYLSGRNNYRMPAYNRIDLGVNYHKQKKHGTATWNLSVYNVYNRQNPFIVLVDDHYETDENGDYVDSYPVMKQMSIFPIIPTISYSFKF